MKPGFAPWPIRLRARLMWSSLTGQLAERAWALFREVEAQGGLGSALESGFVAEKLRRPVDMQQRAVARRREKLTGISEFSNLSETAPASEPAIARAEGAPALASGLALPAAGKGGTIRSPCRRRRRWRDAFRTARGFANCERYRVHPSQRRETRRRALRGAPAAVGHRAGKRRVSSAHIPRGARQLGSAPRAGGIGARLLRGGRDRGDPTGGKLRHDRWRSCPSHRAFSGWRRDPQDRRAPRPLP